METTNTYQSNTCQGVQKYNDELFASTAILQELIEQAKMDPKNQILLFQMSLKNLHVELLIEHRDFFQQTKNQWATFGTGGK